MAQTMTASQKPMTTGQVDNLVAKFRAALTKHRTEMTAQTAQQVLGVENLGTELYDVIRMYAERFANMFSRHVTVDQSRSPQAALDATGRTQYTDAKVVAAIPRGQAKEELFFFKLSRYVSDDELEKEYAARGLKPASPYSLAKANEDDPAFADTHPNGTHWKDAKGDWCFATFDGWLGERSVDVDRRDGGWSDFWWFAGVRK
jgi:hypothetical protein